MKKEIPRAEHLRSVEKLLRQQRVVLLLGARQVGKTTLAHQVAGRQKSRATFFDLENPKDVAKLDEPMLALEPLKGLVVIDEVHNRPNLFPILRVLADRPRSARFLLLGSASPDLLQQGSETLAGRITFYELSGFDLQETGIGNVKRLWFRGAFPRSYLSRSDVESGVWRRDFVRTFLERDLPQLGTIIPSGTLRRFWTMLAHYHGQIWNSSEFGRSFGVSHTTVRKYLDLLSNTFVVRQLPPWTENVGKRVVKSPKVFIRDSGILHTLLSLERPTDLEGHPKVGASWEGFAMNAVIRKLRAREDQCYFWATHSGAELDLLVVHGNRRRGFEFKRTDSPKMTASMRSAFEDLSLDRLDVVYAGSDSFPMRRKVRALALKDVEDL